MPISLALLVARAFALQELSALRPFATENPGDDLGYLGRHHTAIRTPSDNRTIRCYTLLFKVYMASHSKTSANEARAATALVLALR
jgi:hypothetical protein